MTPENKNINGAGLEHFSSIIKDELAGKQDSLTAGSNINISNTNIISAITPNASTSTVGGLTVRLSGTSLYIRNDGGEA